MHVVGTGVPRCLGVARSTTSPKAALALGCSLTPGLQISCGVTCMARAASVPGLWTLGLLLWCGVCVSVWVVLGFRFLLRPATPGWGVGVCVCLCVHSACTPRLLAGVCGVRVYALAPDAAAPRHCCLGCRGVCLLVCAFRLYPATLGWDELCACVFFGSGTRLRPTTPGWGVGVCVLVCVLRSYPAPFLAGVCAVVVCAWARVSAAPRLSWLGRWGVRVCVLAPLVPRHSWLGCAAWVCVLGLGFQLPPASPSSGVGVCVCSCALSTGAPPLLARVRGVGGCA